MEAKALYELVKDCPEVWDDDCAFDLDRDFPCMRDYFATGNGVGDVLAELALEGCFARATGCGVNEYGPTDYFAETPARFSEGYISARGPTRLAALVAAYRAQRTSDLPSQPQRKEQGHG